jgi:hypothetical protein
MALYGADSLKPQRAWSNSPFIGSLNTRKPHTRSSMKTYTSYENATGKSCYTANGNLKLTQNLVPLLMSIYVFYLYCFLGFPLALFLIY